MKYRIYTRYLIVLVLIFFIGSCRRAGIWLVKDDKPARADAIVILMGSVDDRVLEAADLYKQKVAEKILIVGPNKKSSRELAKNGTDTISNSQQSYLALVNLGIPSDSIIILPGYPSRRTITEALTIRNYLANKSGLDTLILVSSAEHMQRAAIIFKSVFRSSEHKVMINCSPSKYTKFNADKWWKSKHGIQTVVEEYLKIAGFFIFDRKHFVGESGSAI